MYQNNEYTDITHAGFWHPAFKYHCCFACELVEAGFIQHPRMNESDYWDSYSRDRGGLYVTLAVYNEHAYTHKQGLMTISVRLSNGPALHVNDIPTHLDTIEAIIKGFTGISWYIDANKRIN